MSEQPRVTISLLPTGVPGLDDVLGGGLPEFSCNLITGPPGAGKTTLAQQLMFALASAARPALYFTVLGEPPLKMLRYQQQMAFFDPAKVGASVHYRDLTEVVLTQDLERVFDDIVRQVQEATPGIVVVDSFQTVAGLAGDTAHGALGLQSFVQRLAIQLTSVEATTFLVGEAADGAQRGSPVFTVADGILWLSQSVHRNSVVRKLQVLKSRGQAPMPGLHPFRISQAGIRVFPHMSSPREAAQPAHPPARLATGVAGLDDLMGGGIPAGDSVLVAGPPGAGKSALAAQFIAAGARRGEPGVIAVFEEHPRKYLARAAALGADLAAMADQGLAQILYLRLLDLSPDETILEIGEAVRRRGARRVVIDSLAGFELALAPTFRADFGESLYRLAGALTGMGITVLLTREIGQTSTDLHLGLRAASFLVDDVILLRVVEVAGRLEKVLVVLKMRGSAHSDEFTLYEITARGLVVRGPLRACRANAAGGAGSEELAAPAYPGLIEREVVVLQALIELREAPSEAVARRTGLPGPELAAALDRLVGLAYAVRLGRGARAAYRPVARLVG